MKTTGGNVFYLWSTEFNEEECQTAKVIRFKARNDGMTGSKNNHSNLIKTATNLVHQLARSHG